MITWHLQDTLKTYNQPTVYSAILNKAQGLLGSVRRRHGDSSMRTHNGSGLFSGASDPLHIASIDNQCDQRTWSWQCVPMQPGCVALVDVAQLDTPGQWPLSRVPWQCVPCKYNRH